MPAPVRSKKGGLPFATDRPRESALLVNDLDYATGARVHKHGPIIHDRIPIFAHRGIIIRYVVIRHAIGRKHGSNGNRLCIGVRPDAAALHIATEARTVFDTEYTRDTADHTANGGADRCANRPSRSLAITGAAFHATRHTLRQGQLAGGEESSDKDERLQS
jgi:hypothetical protein